MILTLATCIFGALRSVSCCPQQPTPVTEGTPFPAPNPGPGPVPMCALEHLPFHLHPTPAGPGITIAPVSTREVRAARWRSGAVVAEAAGELWGPEGDAANTWDSDCSTVAMSASDDCDTQGRPDSGSGDSASTDLTGDQEEEEDTVGSVDRRPGSGSGEDRTWCGLQSPLSQGTLPSPGSTGTLSMGASPWGFKLHNFGQGGTGTSVAYGGDAGEGKGGGTCPTHVCVCGCVSDCVSGGVCGCTCGCVSGCVRVGCLRVHRRAPRTL
jgi:hypothetical protein